jgi:hypothetical protein
MECIRAILSGRSRGRRSSLFIAESSRVEIFIQRHGAIRCEASRCTVHRCISLVLLVRLYGGDRQHGCVYGPKPHNCDVRHIPLWCAASGTSARDGRQAELIRLSAAPAHSPEAPGRDHHAPDSRPTRAPRSSSTLRAMTSASTRVTTTRPMSARPIQAVTPTTRWPSAVSRPSAYPFV